MEKKLISHILEIIPDISSLTPSSQAHLESFMEEQLSRVKRLAEIGLALSAEKNLDLLLGKIIREACHLTNADGGTLYLMDEKREKLDFAVVQNASLHLNMGGGGDPMTWYPVPLYHRDGEKNYANVSAWAALRREVVNIPDVYDYPEFDFEGTRKFDSKTGFRSRSMLVVPMSDHEGEVIGVLQLLNAQDPKTGAVITFSHEAQRITEAMASQAAIAITNSILLSEHEELLDSFIKTIADAIDEKSPYTGGHIKRVADLTLKIARAVNQTTTGPFESVTFDNFGLKELGFAAWLHDVGKIVTPEHLINKSTKLEAIDDGIELIRARFEILKRDLVIRDLEERLSGPAGGHKPEAREPSEVDLDEELQLIENLNRGKQSVSDKLARRLRKVISRKVSIGGVSTPLLALEELENLLIPYGNLTPEERNILQNHAQVTGRLLAGLPFPKKISRVAKFAEAHHEKINGQGYPRGSGGEELSLEARIIALADVLEALTAKDRPYKSPMTPGQALVVMQQMVDKKELDADLFALVVHEGILREYAREQGLGSGDDEFACQAGVKGSLVKEFPSSP
jgi:HD-GYP domain-containing protein (c-di-GMP phosphodiesterase class II)